MPWFKKKQSPIDQRIEELNRKLASLEAEARRQAEEAERKVAAASGQENGQEQPTESTPQPQPARPADKPRFRTTVNPGGAASVHGIEPHEVDFFARRDKPVDFSEPGHPGGAKSKTDKKPVASHASPAGPNLIETLLGLFRAPKPRQDQDRLASFLTTGSFQRLKPLRYERRVARNRLIALVVIVLAIAFLLVKCI